MVSQTSQFQNLNHAPTTMQILCATDFSHSAQAASDVAAAIAKRKNLPLRLLHCGPEWVVAGEIPLPAPVDDAAKLQLDNEVKRLRATGIDVSGEYCQGSASWEVLAAATKQATKLIVLGSTGLGKAGRWLIGSVAERVAEDAPVPTLVVKQPERLLSWLHDGGSLLIMCGVDFTGATDAALSAVREFRELGCTDIETAHIDHDSTADDDPADESRLARQRDLWERIHTALGDLPVKIHVRGTDGALAMEFARMNEERSTDLVVVGTHQRHGWERLKGPSFSRSTLAHTAANVLCVPASSYPAVKRMPEIKRVLLATDFNATSDAAFRHAAALLPKGGSLHVVHVCKQLDAGINPLISSEVYFDHSLAVRKAKDEAERQLSAEIARQQLPDNIRVTKEVLVHENLATGISEAASTFGADVICMGSKGHTQVGVALFGSTVQSVIASTTRPVFIVHPDQR